MDFYQKFVSNILFSGSTENLLKIKQDIFVYLVLWYEKLRYTFFS